MKTIIELSHQEVKSVLLNGALKAFVDNIQPSNSTAVISTQSNAQAPAQAPTQAPAQAPAQAAPTGEVAYTFEQLQRACANLVRDGKREELKAVIDSMQLNSVVELKPEQFNAFAAKIREIGGVL